MRCATWDFGVRQRAGFGLRYPDFQRRFDVPRDCVAARARTASDLPVAMPRRPAAKHFSYVDHCELPIGHWLPPDGDQRRRQEQASVIRSLDPSLAPSCRNLRDPGSITLPIPGHAPLTGGSMPLQIGWLHLPAKISVACLHKPANQQARIDVVQPAAVPERIRLKSAHKGVTSTESRGAAPVMAFGQPIVWRIDARNAVRSTGASRDKCGEEVAEKCETAPSQLCNNLVNQHVFD
jgi:hypothetical protein